jgi:hypothetical protein
VEVEQRLRCNVLDFDIRIALLVLDDSVYVLLLKVCLSERVVHPFDVEIRHFLDMSDFNLILLASERTLRIGVALWPREWLIPNTVGIDRRHHRLDPLLVHNGRRLQLL